MENSFGCKPLEFRLWWIEEFGKLFLLHDLIDIASVEMELKTVDVLNSSLLDIFSFAIYFLASKIYKENL